MIEKGIDIVIRGPCNIKVAQGRVDISGIEITDTFHIGINKTFTITTLTESEIKLDCNVLSRYPSLGWRNVAEEISGKIVIIGKQNSGKSYLANLISNIQKAPILDADIGQSSIFIPTFVSLSDFKETLTPKEKGIRNLEFYGDITPSVNPKFHLALISKLSYLLNNVVVDTDGWVSGYQSYRHKIELIYSIDPDFIILFEDSNMNLPSDIRRRAIIVKSFPLAVDRDKNQRKLYRKNLYKEYFSTENEIKMGTSKLFGISITDRLFISWGEMIQLSDEEPCEGYYIKLEDIKGLLVGLTLKGKTIGAGLITDITKDYVIIRTREKEADGILLGNINLNENFEERRVKIKKCSKL